MLLHPAILTQPSMGVSRAAYIHSSHTDGVDVGRPLGVSLPPHSPGRSRLMISTYQICARILKINASIHSTTVLYVAHTDTCSIGVGKFQDLGFYSAFKYILSIHTSVVTFNTVPDVVRILISRSKFHPQHRTPVSRSSAVPNINKTSPGKVTGT